MNYRCVQCGERHGVHKMDCGYSYHLGKCSGCKECASWRIYEDQDGTPDRLEWPDVDHRGWEGTEWCAAQLGSKTNPLLFNVFNRTGDSNGSDRESSEDNDVRD